MRPRLGTGNAAGALQMLSTRCHAHASSFCIAPTVWRPAARGAALQPHTWLLHVTYLINLAMKPGARGFMLTCSKYNSRLVDANGRAHPHSAGRRYSCTEY